MRDDNVKPMTDEYLAEIVAALDPYDVVERGATRICMTHDLIAEIKRLKVVCERIHEMYHDILRKAESYRVEVERLKAKEH